MHITASSLTNADRAYGLEQGADAYLTHPFDPDVLLATARALLRASPAEGERAKLLVSERGAREAAAEASFAKTQLLSTLSHELRTPLNSVLGHIGLLDADVYGSLTDAQRDALSRARRSALYLAALIDDLLNFARLESGCMEYVLSDVPVVVRADMDKVRIILVNLVTNAIKFTAPGGHVTLACTRDETSDVVYARVQDTGRGIPREQAERIFEPFLQLDRQSLKQSQQGVGLGPAISRTLALGMGSDLTIESEEGVGSTFTLSLPVASHALSGAC